MSQRYGDLSPQGREEWLRQLRRKEERKKAVEEAEDELRMYNIGGLESAYQIADEDF